MRKRWWLAIAVVALAGFLMAGRMIVIHRTINDMAGVDLGAFTGPADARNVIVEFMDYRCAYCRKINPQIEEFAKRHPDVKIVFRHFPIYVAPSVKEASLAMAAAKQGKFMPMHDYLMSREQAVEDSEIPGIAQQLGLDPEQLQKDMRAGDIGKQLLDTLDGAKLLGIDRTPSFLFNGAVYIPNGGIPDLPGFEALYRQYAEK